MSDLFGLSRVYLNVSEMRVLEQLILKQQDRSLFIAAKNGEPWVISGYEEANGPLRTENYRCTVISANYFSQSLVPRGNNDRYTKSIQDLHKLAFTFKFHLNLLRKQIVSRSVVIEGENICLSNHIYLKII